MRKNGLSTPSLMVSAALLSLGLHGCGGGENNGATRQGARGSQAHAATVSVTTSSPGYFVDASRGLDTNEGSYDKPYRTLAKAKSALSNASPIGSGIYLRCDDVNGQSNIWRESLVLNQTNAPHELQIRGYGNCNSSVKATLTGGDDLSGQWVPNGLMGNPENAPQCRRWTRKLASGTPPAIRVVMWRPGPTGTVSETLRLAQWPNHKAITFGPSGVLSSGSRQYALAQAGSDLNTLNTATNFSALGDVMDATVQLRSSAYYIESRKVTGANGATLTLSAGVRDNYLGSGDGYLLQNKEWMLDSADEFFHKIQEATASTPKVNELHVCVDQSFDMNANTIKVEASTSRDNLLAVTGRQRVLIQDVAVRMARLDGIVLKDAPGSTISGADALFNGRAGIRVHGPTSVNGTNTLVANNLAQYNWIMGIDTRNASGPHTIRANSVYDTGTEGYAGGSVPAATKVSTLPEVIDIGTYGYIAGIGAGSGATVTSNVIHRTAMIGIRFHGSATIADNDVFDYCQRLSDSGAIYSWVGGDGLASTRSFSSIITGNRMVNGRLNTEGTPPSDSAREIVAGLYVDDFLANVTATDNLIAQSPVGIYVHNGIKTRISNNKVWLTTRKALSVNVESPHADAVQNVYSNNQLAPLASMTGTTPIGPNTYQGVPKSTYSYAYSVVSKFTGMETLDINHQHFSDNQVVMLNSPHQSAAYFLRNAEPKIEHNLTATGWKSLNPGETVPLLIPATFDLIKMTTEGNLVAPLGASVAVPWRSAGPGFPVSETPYVVRFTGTYGDIVRAKLQLFDSASGTSSLLMPLSLSEHWSGSSGLDTLTGSAGETLSYEGFMLPNARGTGRLDIIKIEAGTLSLSSVGIHKLSSYQVGKAADWVKLVTGSRSAITNVTCQSLWGVDAPSNCQVKDLLGNVVTMPTTIPVNENRVYLRMDSTWRH